MTALSRRRFNALTGIATIGAAVPLRFAKATEFAFKLGTNLPENPSVERICPQGSGRDHASNRRPI